MEKYGAGSEKTGSFFTLKMETANSCETFVTIYQTIWRHMPEDRREIPKPHAEH
jgi:hypothetical protein